MDNFLDSHLNVYWLRPECALWDAIASSVISRHTFHRPSLDLGSGNGIFSFITAGGRFSIEYDWYRNADLTGHGRHRDIYDTFLKPLEAAWIFQKPRYHIDCALDVKRNLLEQAGTLGLYKRTVCANANDRLPFEDEDAAFQTVFSNILYWLHSPEASFKEIHRILQTGGHALLCLPDPKFKEYCPSYQWKDKNSEILRLMNCGRSDSMLWTLTYAEIKGLARKTGFKILSHASYLSPLTLQIWDIGLRPLSNNLVKMTHKLNEEDRRAIKIEWMETVRPFLMELFELEARNGDPKGFQFVCLEKM